MPSALGGFPLLSSGIVAWHGRRPSTLYIEANWEGRWSHVGAQLDHIFWKRSLLTASAPWKFDMEHKRTGIQKLNWHWIDNSYLEGRSWMVVHICPMCMWSRLLLLSSVPVKLDMLSCWGSVHLVEWQVMNVSQYRVMKEVVLLIKWNCVTRSVWCLRQCRWKLHYTRCSGSTTTSRIPVPVAIFAVVKTSGSWGLWGWDPMTQQGCKL